MGKYSTGWVGNMFPKGSPSPKRSYFQHAWPTPPQSVQLLMPWVLQLLVPEGFQVTLHRHSLKLQESSDNHEILGKIHATISITILYLTRLIFYLPDPTCSTSWSSCSLYSFPAFSNRNYRSCYSFSRSILLFLRPFALYWIMLSYLSFSDPFLFINCSISSCFLFELDWLSTIPIPNLATLLDSPWRTRYTVASLNQSRTTLYLLGHCRPVLCDNGFRGPCLTR